MFDITLVSDEGDQVPTHKMILAASSMFFRGLLRRNPHVHPLIFLKGVLHKDLLFLLGFMYRGEVTLGQEELDSFLEAGQTLGVSGLMMNKTGLGTDTKQATGGKKQQKNKFMEAVLEVQEEIIVVKAEAC